MQKRLDEVLNGRERTLSLRAEDDPGCCEASSTRSPTWPGSFASSAVPIRRPPPQRGFDELMEHLTQEVLASSRRPRGWAAGTPPRRLHSSEDMLAELNAMIEARGRGEPHDFEVSPEQYGDLFPDRPRSLDELLESLARRMAAMSRLLASMSPEQRRELEEPRGGAPDLDLASRPIACLEPDLFPTALGRSRPGGRRGGHAVGGDGGHAGAAPRLRGPGEVARGCCPGASLEDVDEEALRRARRDRSRGPPATREIERALEESGLVTRARGRIE